jgi:RNA polymerase sporulation-specific sigma factor
VTEGSLALRARSGDQIAASALVRRYDGFARYLAGEYFIQGAEREDAVAEALHGLAKAIRDWKPDGGRSFNTFACLCMKRQILTAVKAADRDKHHSLTDAVLLSTPVADSGQETVVMGDVLKDAKAPDPVEILARREQLGSAVAFVNRLTPLERSALDGVASGATYEEIWEETGIEPKSIDNALQRVRRKYRREVLEAAA